MMDAERDLKRELRARAEAARHRYVELAIQLCPADGGIVARDQLELLRRACSLWRLAEAAARAAARD
jgi:hypothetical protein